MGYIITVWFLFLIATTSSTWGFVKNIADLRCDRCTLLNLLDCCMYIGRCCPLVENPGECPTIFDTECEPLSFDCIHDDDCASDEKCCPDLYIGSCCRKALPDSGFWPFIDPEPYPYPTQVVGGPIQPQPPYVGPPAPYPAIVQSTSAGPTSGKEEVTPKNIAGTQ